VGEAAGRRSGKEENRAEVVWKKKGKASELVKPVNYGKRKSETVKTCTKWTMNGAEVREGREKHHLSHPEETETEGVECSRTADGARFLAAFI